MPALALKLDVLVLAPAWRRRLPRAAALCRRAALAALRVGRAKGSYECTIALADDRLLRQLNRQYRGKDRATNVLAFPADVATQRPPRRSRPLGDIAISLDTVQREARRQGKALASHLSHLAVHGVLHLLGHDHTREQDAKAMESLEIMALSGLGIANPYELPQD